MLIFVIILILVFFFLPKLSYAVGKMIVGPEKDDDDYSKSSGKTTFHEHNYYTQNNTHQHLHLTDKKPDPKSINDGD